MGANKKEVEKFSDLWNTYFSEVVPENACETQRRETKLAFYSGAFGVITLLTKKDQTSEETSHQLTSFFDELNEFVAEVTFDAITKGKKTGTA